MKFELEPIHTEGKPGELVNIDIQEICKKLKLNFLPNKIFYMTDLNSKKSRGDHSNYNASEILICLNGSFEIKLNDGKNETIYTINKNEGIYIPKNIWLSFYDFKNCVIVVFVEIDIKIEKESEYNFEVFKSKK